MKLHIFHETLVKIILFNIGKSLLGNEWEKFVAQQKQVFLGQEKDLLNHIKWQMKNLNDSYIKQILNNETLASAKKQQGHGIGTAGRIHAAKSENRFCL